MKKAIDRPLSAEQVVQLMGGDAEVNFYTFPELSKMRSVEDIFRGGKSKALFLTLHPGGKQQGYDQFGHFEALFRPSPNVLEFVDSFRKKPEQFLDEEYGDSWRRKSGQQPGILKRLLKQWLLVDPEHRTLFYNEIPFQKHGSSTCGRWVGLRGRLLGQFPRLEDFQKWALGDIRGKDPDAWVVSKTDAYIPPEKDEDNDHGDEEGGGRRGRYRAIRRRPFEHSTSRVHLNPFAFQTSLYHPPTAFPLGVGGLMPPSLPRTTDAVTYLMTQRALTEAATPEDRQAMMLQAKQVTEGRTDTALGRESHVAGPGVGGATKKRKRGERKKKLAPPPPGTSAAAVIHLIQQQRAAAALQQREKEIQGFQMRQELINRADREKEEAKRKQEHEYVLERIKAAAATRAAELEAEGVRDAAEIAAAEAREKREEEAERYQSQEAAAKAAAEATLAAAEVAANATKATTAMQIEAEERRQNATRTEAQRQREAAAAAQRAAEKRQEEDREAAERQHNATLEAQLETTRVQERTANAARADAEAARRHAEARREDEQAHEQQLKEQEAREQREMQLALQAAQQPSLLRDWLPSAPLLGVAGAAALLSRYRNPEAGWTPAGKRAMKLTGLALLANNVVRHSYDPESLHPATRFVVDAGKTAGQMALGATALGMQGLYHGYRWVSGQAARERMADVASTVTDLVVNGGLKLAGLPLNINVQAVTQPLILRTLKRMGIRSMNDFYANQHGVLNTIADSITGRDRNFERCLGSATSEQAKAGCAWRLGLSEIPAANQAMDGTLHPRDQAFRDCAADPPSHFLDGIIRGDRYSATRLQQCADLEAVGAFVEGVQQIPSMMRKLPIPPPVVQILDAATPSSSRTVAQQAAAVMQKAASGVRSPPLVVPPAAIALNLTSSSAQTPRDRLPRSMENEYLYPKEEQEALAFYQGWRKQSFWEWLKDYDSPFQTVAEWKHGRVLERMDENGKLVPGAACDRPDAYKFMGCEKRATEPIRPLVLANPTTLSAVLPAVQDVAMKTANTLVKHTLGKRALSPSPPEKA